MSPRRQETTRWLWCLLALYAGTAWRPVESGSVRSPPKNPTAGIEAQAKFFQDFFSVQLSPYKIEFGHVCEDPNNWEQRYEKKDFKNHRDMGKVRWGDKNGGYGEHYWDLNHAGHSNEHDDDGYDSDHGYDRNDSEDSYDEPSEQSSQINNDEDNTYENVPKYDNEDGNRSKRAHTRNRSGKKAIKNPDNEGQAEKPLRRNREQVQTAYSHNVEKVSEQIEDGHIERKPKHKRINHARRHIEEARKNGERHIQNSENTATLQSEPAQYEVRQHHEQTKYVPYEQGSGVRQHQQAEEVTAASATRLFWEPSSGHVVDRATGRAYVLQPILVSN